MKPIRRCLISVSDKAGIIALARALSNRGVEILSTGGTAKTLKDAGLAVVDVAAYTGSPEILDGRLKTLHPKIHGGLLGRRDIPAHLAQMAENGIGPIDMVVVNLYPFEETVASVQHTFEEAVENIDIGGPSMLRSAAKNHADVAVVVDPADYEGIIAEMNAHDGALSPATRFRLAKKAFFITARYDTAIANYLCQRADDHAPLSWPERIGFVYEKVADLRYGENPHQKAAFYRESRDIREPGIAGARQLQGKELSYNNIMDADAALDAVGEFVGEDFTVVVVKHANPCGAAVSAASLADAYAKALACDPTSAFGGIIGANRVVDEETARAIAETFYEVIAAPGFEPGALAVLGKKKNLRLMEVPGFRSPGAPVGCSLRKVIGGMLVQERDTSCEDVRASKVVTQRAPTDAEWRGLAFAWRICKHVKSNAIVYAASDRTLGIGAGQMSRVDASRIAAMKMQEIGQGPRDVTVVASDAFFPFRDGIDAAAAAGATAIVQPGGSVRDDEAIAAADEHGMAMVFTGVRHFRH